MASERQAQNICRHGVITSYSIHYTKLYEANAIAFDVRERGREKREGNPVTGKVVRDADGNPVMIPGSLKAVKAIGWYIRNNFV